MKIVNFPQSIYLFTSGFVKVIGDAHLFPLMISLNIVPVGFSKLNLNSLEERFAKPRD